MCIDQGSSTPPMVPCAHAPVLTLHLVPRANACNRC
jgi:hypothetical protein